MSRSHVRYFAIAALAAIALAACSSSAKPASTDTSPATNAPTTTEAPATTPTSGGASSGTETVKIATSAKLGKILVDSSGMTLYVDERDKPGKPDCTGGCLTAWPPAPAPASPAFASGLDASIFSSITLTDGTKQLTVKGSPLYTWMNDKKAGDTTGQDVNGFYVVQTNGTKYDPGASAGS